VELITATLLELIDEYRDDYESRSQAYFADLGELLDTHVDFTYIARGVMGPFYGRASEAQIERFIAVFRAGLIETYGRGLGSYNNQRIELLPHEAVDPEQRTVTVRQQIISEGTIYPLQYSMGKNRSSGEWQIINVIINGINLGKTFRSQFVQAANRNGGDIDAVIDGWATTTEE
jgi:phospholipid transport system substrate-binding protein